MSGSIPQAFRLLVVALFFSAVSNSAEAGPIAALRLYNVDDQMSAYVTNSAYSGQLMMQTNFLNDSGYVDVSSYLRKGKNTIHLTDFNGPAGWTYGYDFKFNGVSYSANSCGTANVIGCDGNDQTPGIVWSKDITFHWNGHTTINPSTYTLRFFNVDDQMSAYLTNSKNLESLVLQTNFFQDSGDIDISKYVVEGLNSLTIQDINGPAGWTIGYDFRIDGITYSADKCGNVNIFGCNDNEYVPGLVYSRTIDFDVPGTRVPEPGTLSLMAGLIGLFFTRRRHLALSRAMRNGRGHNRFDWTGDDDDRSKCKCHL